MIGGADTTTLVGGLKRLQRRFGRLHDRQVLVAESPRRAAHRAAHTRPGPWTSLASDLETDCRRWHGAAMAAAGAIDDSVAGARRLAAVSCGRRPCASAAAAAQSAGVRPDNSERTTSGVISE